MQTGLFAPTIQQIASDSMLWCMRGTRAIGGHWQPTQATRMADQCCNGRAIQRLLLRLNDISL